MKKMKNIEDMTISEFAEQVLGLQLYSFQKDILEKLYKIYKENNSIPLTAIISRGCNKSIELGYTSVIIFYDEFIGEDSDVHSNSRRGTMD